MFVPSLHPPSPFDYYNMKTLQKKEKEGIRLLVLTLFLKLSLAMLNGDHSKQHSSKTTLTLDESKLVFWDHSKQHSSKTIIDKKR